MLLIRFFSIIVLHFDRGLIPAVTTSGLRVAYIEIVWN
jgi:hypothetical protein